MKILSIHDGHNASAALFEDGKVLAAISEERLNRNKFYWGWPELSISYVLTAGSLKLDEIDVVTVSHLDTIDYIKRKIALGDLFTWNPKFFLGNLINIYQTFCRERKVRSLFTQSKKKPVFFFCDHHLAHAASAYYFSGFDDALVVTIDGLGDSLSHSAYAVKSGIWTKLIHGNTSESLGAFYGAVTEGLGFKQNRHEGKVVGLAAMGDAKKVQDAIGDYYVTVSKDGKGFKRRGYGEMVEKVKELLSEGFSREDIAAHAQNLLERIVISHINKLYHESELPKKLALAGGVFANVKLNQKIIEQCPIDGIFIQPAMGDEGLVLGSARYFLAIHQGVVENSKMEHVYFGAAYSNEEIETVLKANQCSYRRSNEVALEVAGLIAEGKIIGWFDGQMEFGPRALGHRTIMASPIRREINDELNKRLQRSEFMPFAPSILAESAEDVFEKINFAFHTAEFMTITFQVNEKWSSKIQAVVHIDETARPQLVRSDRNSPFHAVIKEFQKITGIPLIVNTSFNMHEEPIVCSPEDAIRSFKTGAVDYLVFNNTFIVSKQ